MRLNGKLKILETATYWIIILLLEKFRITSTASVCPGDTTYDVSSKECVCPTDMFYDKVTKSCAYCFQICHNAELQRTEDECYDFCPDYQLPAVDTGATNTADVTNIICSGDMFYDKMENKCSCRKDEYFDRVTKTCSACYDICSNADIQNTADDCKSSCPNFTLSYSTTLSTPPSRSDSNAVIILVTIFSFVGIFFICFICVWCLRKRLELRVCNICAMLVVILPCLAREKRGNEADQDRHNESVQLAIQGRPPDNLNNKQPDDKGNIGPVIPSGNAVEDRSQETEAKVALLPDSAAL